ncbi:MAG TPA: ATP-binding protein, partial [Isosphaeraceae bacterium]|nr:ATP-binding protein [Isosphaeraceae bacterium]
ARCLLASLDHLPIPQSAVSPLSEELDPGWILGRWFGPEPKAPLALLSDRPWWPAARGVQAAALERLWKHSVAVSWAARRLAQEAGDPDAERIGRVGLLHNLGYWAIAAADAASLAELLSIAEPRARRSQERAWLGRAASALGQRLAEAWSDDPLLADAAAHFADAESDLTICANDPARLAVIQRAFTWAERTPWALFGLSNRTPGAPDPRLRLLMAEVQSLCGPPFIDGATAFEEGLARSHARLLVHMNGLKRENASLGGLAHALGTSRPTDGPVAWAETARQEFASLPGVESAQVTWIDPPIDLAECPGADDSLSAGEPAADKTCPQVIVALPARGKDVARVALRVQPECASDYLDANVKAAWGAWADLVAERCRLEARHEALVESVRRSAEREDDGAIGRTMEALAEFAAGAGHELNNPLAVIVGRAQLLLGKARDTDVSRSLRTIIAQAQRAHRMLRDLMYVARPPQPRPRSCLPDEIVRSCLRDLKDEAEARGVRLLADSGAGGQPILSDPDGLRHLAETFARNALEATPPGGLVRFHSSLEGRQLVWSIHDTGTGLSTAEAKHLFHPFFCGRQAGRGLGLGLPRAARFLAQCGGHIRWKSQPGRGTAFHLTVPLLALDAAQPLSLSCTRTDAARGQSGPPHAQGHRIGDRMTVRA